MAHTKKIANDNLFIRNINNEFQQTIVNVKYHLIQFCPFQILRDRGNGRPMPLKQQAGRGDHAEVNRRVRGAEGPVRIEMEGGASEIQRLAAYGCKQSCLPRYGHAALSGKRDNNFQMVGILDISKITPDYTAVPPLIIVYKLFLLLYFTSGTRTRRGWKKYSC